MMNFKDNLYTKVMGDTRLIASRVFTLKDQEKFALLSGDFNSIHVSPILARRSIAGECIVHGINSFLWCLEELTRNGFLYLGGFDITFRYYIPLDKISKIYTHHWNTVTFFLCIDDCIHVSRPS